MANATQHITSCWNTRVKLQRKRFQIFALDIKDNIVTTYLYIYIYYNLTIRSVYHLAFSHVRNASYQHNKAFILPYVNDIHPFAFELQIC